MTFPTSSFSQQAYTQGPGTTGMFWPIISNRSPTANDVFYGPQTYKVGQIWFNSTAETIWFLDSFSNAPSPTNLTGQLQATWVQVVTNTTQILSLSDNANVAVFPTSTSAMPNPSNIQITGQLNEQVTPVSTVVANAASHIIEINPMSPARWIVDPLSTSPAPNGTHSTIQTALDAASAGDTIILMPGNYGGTITLKKSVNVVAFDDDIIGNVIISGSVILDSSTATSTFYSFSGIRFQRNTGTCLTVSGNVVKQLFLTRCTLNVSGTATGISLTNSAINSEVVLNYCAGDASDATSKIFAMSGTDANSSFITFNACYFTNGVATTVASSTANTNSSGFVVLKNSTFYLPITTSGSASLQAFDTDFTQLTGTNVGNVTNLTIGGSGTNKVIGCVLSSGSALAASITSTVLMTSTTITSSNAPALSGAGTINFGGLVFVSNSTNSVNTKNLLTVT
jgi:hypothetical protein